MRVLLIRRLRGHLLRDVTRWSRAIETPQRCKNSRKESCVIASASGMTSPVPLRVGPALTCELIALRDNSELDTKPEEASPLTSCIEAGGCAGVASVPFCGS